MHVERRTPLLVPANGGDLEDFGIELDAFRQIRDLNPGLDALRVLRHPGLELQFGIGLEDELQFPGGFASLSCSVITMRSSDSCTSMIWASRTRLTSLLSKTRNSV